MTFGILREPWSHPAVQGFIDRLDDVTARADASPGLIAQYRYEDTSEGNPFGPVTMGRFVTPDLADRVAQTLSLWATVEAVFAFAYAANHAEALRQRRDWFLKGSWPTYVAWWVADDCWPRWRDANTRFEHLHDHGSTAYAFDFRSPFDAEGRPSILDRARIAELQRS
jgi:hypothetical protein